MSDPLNSQEQASSFVESLTTEQKGEDYGRILVVDDDQQLRLLVARLLQRHGYEIVAVADGRDALAQLARQDFEVVILDLMMPERSGMAVCGDIRSRSNVPIIMLTARPEEDLRIVGLEGGADDFMTKPFNPRELLARIRVLLRRSRSVSPTTPRQFGQVYVFEQWRLDTRRRELTSPAGVLVDLSTGEYNLLVALLEHAGRVLSRELLMEMAKARAGDAFDRSIDVQVSRLRRKLETDGSEQMVKTIRGAGYSLVSKVTVAEEPAP